MAEEKLGIPINSRNSQTREKSVICQTGRDVHHFAESYGTVFQNGRLIIKAEIRNLFSLFLEHYLAFSFAQA